jgi:bacteriocin-like protein
MSTESIGQSLSTVSTDSALSVARHNDELSEDELEAVTGGAGFPGGIGSHIPILPRPGVGPGGYGSTPRYTQTQDLSIL